MDAATDATIFALECQSVVALRMAKLASGGRRARAEAQLMFIEKIAAAVVAGTIIGSGKPLEKVARHYRSKIRANRRRLSK
jgi:hypothetical protein